MGRDFRICAPAMYCSRFQSTLPAWGETSSRSGHGTQSPFQSTLPAWGETYSMRLDRGNFSFQSTLPAWGETAHVLSCTMEDLLFQSTLPAWGETAASGARWFAEGFQSTLPAWGETEIQEERTEESHDISIHSPRMGRDHPVKTIKYSHI